MNGFYISTGQTTTIDLSTDVIQSGPGAGDYTLVPTTGCVGAGTGIITLPGGALCLMQVYFTPGGLGNRSATMTIHESDGGYEIVNLNGVGVGGLGFGEITLGTYGGPDTFTLLNKNSSTDTIDLSTGMSFSGQGADDYLVTPSSSCTTASGGNTVILAPTSACTMNVSFYPGALGERDATVTIQGSVGAEWSVLLQGAGTIGYYQVDSLGNVATAGDAAYYGDAGGSPLNRPIVGMAVTPDGGGYWLVASDGGIFSFGDAAFYGSTGAIHLNKPIVGDGGDSRRPGLLAGRLRRRDLLLRRRGSSTARPAASPEQADRRHGVRPLTGRATGWSRPTAGSSPSATPCSTARPGPFTLNKPIVGMAATPDGQGYWLVASDGGIFSFGDAPFYGSIGRHPAEPPDRGHGRDADRRWILVQRRGWGVVLLR